MVEENEFEGTARDLGGKVQDAVGGLTGDSETQAKGKWNQVAGKAQKTFGEAADQAKTTFSDATGELRENVVGNPLAALAIVGGVFFALGFLARR